MCFPITLILCGSILSTSAPNSLQKAIKSLISVSSEALSIVVSPRPKIEDKIAFPVPICVLTLKLTVVPETCSAFK